MSQTAMMILGFSAIFFATTAGSAIVWFFKRDISEKVNTLFVGLRPALWSRRLCGRSSFRP